MRNYFSSSKFRITLCVCIALLLGIFVAAVSDGGSSPLSSAVSFVMTPFQNAAADLAGAMKNFNGYFASSGSYAKQVEELQSEVASLRAELVDYENLKYKLTAYEEFLDVKERNPDYQFLPASVILRDSSDIYGSFTLNCGSADGVKTDDPVIYGNSLVGVVREVTDKTCLVNTILNPSVSVGAYEIRTREDSYTESENALALRGLIKLSGLSRSTPVVAGGIVCTSGIGGIYPRDLTIGTITEIVNEESAVSAYALIEPDIDPAQLSDVFIITGFNGKGAR